MHVMVQCESNPGHRGLGIALSMCAPDPSDLQDLVLTEEYPQHFLLCLFRLSGAVSKVGALVELAQFLPSLHVAGKYQGAPRVEPRPPRAWDH